jgi:hypothetical protein
MLVRIKATNAFVSVERGSFTASMVREGAHGPPNFDADQQISYILNLQS